MSESELVATQEVTSAHVPLMHKFTHEHASTHAHTSQTMNDKVEKKAKPFGSGTLRWIFYLPGLSIPSIRD